MSTISHARELTPAQREAVLQLASTARDADGVDPLNEAAGFAVRGQRDAEHWLALASDSAEPDTVVGYAQLDTEARSLIMVVDPRHRRQGVATALLEAVRRVEPHPSLWAFGNGAPARALAAARGLRLTRELLVMRRDLTSYPVTPSEQSARPDGPIIDTFTDADLEQLVEVNAIAFAHHPEQGALSAADFRARMSEPWFDPAGLFVARDQADPTHLLGFHWTKIDTDPAHGRHGEVYAIGVRPEAGGKGVGRALLAAGLHHLQERGVDQILLYVEADADRTVAMYRAAGFAELTRDASYQ